jgi:predicted glycoside hydrolase/deacetylase ChbG (UPF0249 family)
MIVCADDFGMSEDIDRAILELAGRKKLSAVSCMTALARCTGEALEPLLHLKTKVDLGLHLCLADKALRAADFESDSGLAKTPFPSLNQFSWKLMTRRISRTQVGDSIREQYGLFIKKTGQRPDFIDGHLHTHQLPVVRQAVVEFVKTLPSSERPYVRNTRMRVMKLGRRKLPMTKAFLIGKFGAKMSRSLERNGIETNANFAGIYDFRHASRFGEYLAGFAACLKEPNGLLVTHPGESEEWRRAEFKALSDFEFPAGMPNRFLR